MWLNKVFQRPPEPAFQRLHEDVGRDIIPHGCISVDVSFSTLLFAFRSFFTTQDREAVSARIIKLWNTQNELHGHSDNVIVALSVRTIFDLWLQTMAFPPGSQILMSAVNIPDMLTVLKHHELVPVPVDLSLESLEPNYQSLTSQINERTVAILVAHIFGRRFEMDTVLDIAKKHNLKVVEDLAQAFTGLDYTGHPSSDLSLFSFGTIKTASSFGGGLARVRNDKAYQKMLEIMSNYPSYPRLEYFLKIVKILPFWVISHNEFLGWFFLAISYGLSFNHKDLLVSLVRGFPKGQLMIKLKHQASVPMLLVLERSLRTFNSQKHQKFTWKVDAVVEKLHEAGIKVPGIHATHRNYWLFPIIVKDPDAVCKALESCGVDATRVSTQLACIIPSEPDSLLPEQPRPVPKNSEEMMKAIMYLPIHKRLSTKQLNRIVDCVLAVEGLRRPPAKGKPVRTPTKSKLESTSTKSKL